MEDGHASQKLKFGSSENTSAKFGLNFSQICTKRVIFCQIWLKVFSFLAKFDWIFQSLSPVVKFGLKCFHFWQNLIGYSSHSLQSIQNFD